MNTSLRRTTIRAVAVLGAALIGSTGLTIGAMAAPTAGSATTAPPWEPDASSVGGLTFYNAAGQVITGGNITDSPIAAYVEGSGTVRSGDTKATLFGYLPVDGESPGQWSGEQLGSSTTYPNTAAPAPLKTSTLPVETGASGDETVAQLAADFPNTDKSTDGYAGFYVLRLKTSAVAKPANTTYESADIQITGSTWALVYPAPTLTSTTTTLTTVPGSPQVSGTSVTLTATVSPSAPGTVQFENGSTDIGSPVTVSGATASISTTTLPIGTDTLNAVFTPTSGSGFSGSTGTAPFTVTSGTVTKTKTKLTTAPGSPQKAGTSVTLTATVSPSAPGTVQFENGSTDVGSPVTVSGGKASISTTALTVGKDKLSAIFTPTSGSGFAASTGTKKFTVTGATLTKTKTTLATTPTSPQKTGTSVTLTATVSPSAPGTVQFENGSTDIGSPVTVSGGKASISTTALTVGKDKLSAIFTPTSGSGFAASTGTKKFTVTP